MKQVDGVRRKMKIFHGNAKMEETNDIAKSCLRMRASRNVSLIRGCFALTLILLIQTQFAEAITRPREEPDSSMEAIASRYCDFLSTEKIYNITNLVQCMNELASAAVSRSRIGRASEDYFFPNPKKSPAYLSTDYQYPRRQTNDFQSYYERRPSRVFPDSASYQSGQSGYYDGGSKYSSGVDQPNRLPGGVGARLFEALASISQYDDLKCVSRILCEVATGVVPGNAGYRQGYDGGNSLISLLTTLETGETSPLLSFGKSALMGYANRGNPNICYRQYPKCPRSSAELIDYLNNHNGGFFRFFGNVRGSGYQGSYYRGNLRRQPAPPPGISGPESDRTEYNESDKITFPQEPLRGEQSLNRVSKSLMPFSDTANDYQNSPFFPQDRNDPESNLLYSLNPSMQIQNRQFPQATGSRKGRLYLPEDPINETISTYTFPDGQKVQINVAFSKLFSENYSKALRRSFANDHGPEPVNFESFSMINLAELFPNDRARLDLQVVHPCDMVCHDSKGTPVQFSQILLHSRKLSTLMTPDQPTIDLSETVPCEIICIDRTGEKRQLSTTLNQVLRIDDEQQPGLDVTGFQGSQF
ncbi:uncharacterized protein [Venturia canescens]|uniref:uncharacterized protein isoform X2 n=1 Tax=Venturia canescens TaxID=32260 RepID=UPI001C9C0ABB|nr:uncharacterized protein LOC122414770 isoform X2 [Venturia canescens]